MAEKLTNSGVLGADEQFVELAIAGMGGVAIQIQGTFTGTIAFEATVQGKDFAPFRLTPSDSSTAVTTATAPGLWTGSTVGYLIVRARMSAYTDGSAVVFLQGELASPGGAGGGGGVGSDVNLIEVGGQSITDVDLASTGAVGTAALTSALKRMSVIASDQTPIPVTGSISATNPSVGPFGDPVPLEGTAIGVADPSGDMLPFSAETFDYDTGAGVVAQTVIGIAVPASGGPLPVPGGSGTSAGALRVELPTNGTGVIATVSSVTAIANALPAGNNNIGDVDVASVTGNVTVVQPTGTNLHAVIDSGTITTVSTVTSVTAIANALPAGNNNIGDVDIASSVLPTGAATLAEQQTQTTALGTLLTTTAFNAAFGTAGTADAQVLSVQGITSMTPVQVSQATASNLNATVIGSVADDTVTPGNPVMVGGMAKSPDGTDPGSVSAENDTARAITDLNRRVFVNTDHPRSLHKHLDGTTAYTDESIAADPGDGFQIIITNIIGSNGEAIALNFFLEEGSTKIFGPVYLPAVAGSGFCSGPIRLPVTASTAVTLTSSAANDQSFDIDYYIQAV